MQRGIDQTTTARILDLAEVRARVPLSRTQIWRLERAGQFPSRIRLGPNRVGRHEADIAAWIDSRPPVAGDHSEKAPT